MSRAFLSFFGWCILNGLSKSLRIRTVNARQWPVPVGEANVVFGFWHGEQCTLLHQHRGQNIGIMSSLSKDGELQAGILKRFGFFVARGSSSRGGERALIELIRHLRRGNSAAFAMDGPRGPLHDVKPGIIYSARKSGRSIIPVSVAPKSYMVLEKAWDKYELPRPFTEVAIAYGEPIPISENDDIEEKARLIREKTETLSRFTHTHYWSDDMNEYLHYHPHPRILIVQPSRIGDILFSLPTVAAIRKHYPHAWIGWLGDERCAPILEDCPDINERIIVDRRNLSLGSLRSLKRYLREKSIDVSIDLHGLFKSALMVHLAGARFRIASSSTNGMREFSWLFSKEIKPRAEGTHCVERHLAVAQALGCKASQPHYPIAIAEATRAKVGELLASRGITPRTPFVLMHPGGGWISRRWRPGRFAELSDLLHAKGIRTILIGGKEGGAGEKGLNEEILSLAHSPMIDFTGLLTIKELAALIEKSNLFIANEAGPLHLAVSLNAKAIGLLGPTDPQRTGPFGGRAVVVRHDVCSRQPCRNRTCKNPLCIDSITVEEVFNEAMKVLS